MSQKSFTIISLLFIFGLNFSSLKAQDISWVYSDGTPIITEKQAENTAKEDLPRQFRKLHLGMNLNDVKNALSADSYFNFKGDRDVSLLHSRAQSLIETTGSLFINRAFFQFMDNELFIMSFNLDIGQVDHYSMFTAFIAKYGQPSSLNPKETVWENDNTRISIERPLTIKYIDKRIFNDIINESEIAESGWVQLKQDFISEF
jgi:hypothetical protein